MVDGGLQTLLQAVCAHLDDDAPRAVYADALSEAAEPRGTFIQLQLLKARRGLTPAEASEEQELLAAHQHMWAPVGPPMAEVHFERGFAEAVTLLRPFRHDPDAPTATAWETVRSIHVDVGYGGPHDPLGLLRDPRVRELRSLSGLSLAHLGDLQTAAWWKTLRSLTVREGTGVPPSFLETLSGLKVFGVERPLELPPGTKWLQSVVKIPTLEEFVAIDPAMPVASWRKNLVGAHVKKLTVKSQLPGFGQLPGWSASLTRDPEGSLTALHVTIAAWRPGQLADHDVMRLLKSDLVHALTAARVQVLLRPPSLFDASKRLDLTPSDGDVGALRWGLGRLKAREKPQVVTTDDALEVTVGTLL